MEFAIVLTRLGQFAGAMVVCGSPLFFLYGQAADERAPWLRAVVTAAAALGAVSTLGWLMAQAAALGDAPADALKPAAVWAVAAETTFGRAAGARLLLFLLSLAISGRAGTKALATTALAGAAITASFAWTGHGGMGEDGAGLIHLGADILHLLAAAVWIGALLPLAILALEARAHGGRSLQALGRGLKRFSGLGPAIVAVLVATGLANSYLLVGPSHVISLANNPYGRALLVKLVLFALMLGLAAANRFLFTPRLASEPKARTLPLGGLTMSVLIETLLALAVLIAVSQLGALEPPAGG